MVKSKKNIKNIENQLDSSTGDDKKEIRYILDENMPRTVKEQLILHEPSIDILRVGEDGAPPLGTTDPDILDWGEKNKYILVSRNRRTMPLHLGNHIAKGKHVPGVFLIRKNIQFGKLIKDLLRIRHESEPEELEDQILYLPLEKS